MKEGWERKKLGEICEKICRGISPKYIEEKGVIVLNQKCVRDHSIKYEPSRRHDILTKNVNAEKYLRLGDVLVNSTGEGTLGRVAQVRDLPNEKVTVDSHVSIVRPHIDKFFPDFFGWAMIFIENEITNSGAGASGQTELARTVLENNFTIVYPKSIPDQQRIVTILDEAFAAIDKAKANAEKNLKNAKELFESYLQGVFENKGDGWEDKSIKEIALKIGSGSTPRGGQENYKSEGVSLVRSMNVHDREFRERNLAFIDEQQAKELNGVTLFEGDVLLNITGASIARSCVFPKEYLPARVNQHVSIIRPNKEMLDSKFLNYLLTSKPYKDFLLFTGEQGATRQAITKAQIEAFRVSFPSLDEQIAIVEKIDMVSSETKRLEATYQQKITDLEELKKSILQKAFNGELNTADICV